MDEIDDLLMRFERELDYFVQTRDELMPLLERLVPALEAYLDGRTAGAEGEARVLREAYIGYMRRIGPLLQEWVAIRGSGEQLWEANPFMSEEQAVRFEGLCAREIKEAAGRATFDALHDAARQKLLMFEEMTR